MTSDHYIAEQMFGVGATHHIAKLVVQQNMAGKATLIAGLIVPVLQSIDDQELWECDVYIVPRRKFRRGIFKAHRIDQTLTGGYDLRKNWGEEYFAAGTKHSREQRPEPDRLP